MTPILDVRGVYAGYGEAAVLHDVSFKVDPGQIVALIGANGAGKTTMMHVVSGVHRASAGSVVAAGVVAGKASQRSLVSAGVVLVPEGRHVFGPLTVDENLLLGAYTTPRVAWQARREFVLDLFPRLKERLTQAAGTMSGGEQQMLAIGRALMVEPKLLLLDEPTLGLAPLIVDLIADAMRKLRATGLSMLLVEQNAFVALGLADAGYLLENGRVTASGDGKSLVNDERVKAAYLGR
ncbi:MAG: branched-chain amino acid ABC transporter ATP-binding protein [Rhizobiales bacterium 65-9]|nr:MAG: branched-chain amino acid ABC transporter ATP-binding protein [Rhizobiales bacterium 65-9]